MTDIGALIFDCDGVIADTERDGHRVAFNQAFLELGVGCEWSESLYGELLAIAGGKERAWTYFDRYGWAPQVCDRSAFVQELHARKTQNFIRIITDRMMHLRSGVARLIQDALSDAIPLAICSTSNERSVHLLVETLLGPDIKERFSVILAGDIVSQKKPDPEIYRLAQRRLGVPAPRCVVIEDSRNGLMAAKRAGMRCLVTKSTYTRQEIFDEADLVVDELGDPPGPHIRFDDLRRLVHA